jgi:hypothetical protein
VKYVDAGYVICLTVLFLYAVGLVLRRRRLARAVAVAERPVLEGAVPDDLRPGFSGPDGNGSGTGRPEGGL